LACKEEKQHLELVSQIEGAAGGKKPAGEKNLNTREVSCVPWPSFLGRKRKRVQQKENYSPEKGQKKKGVEK